jgi:DNA-binding beta-propeller fold protein YncE
LIAPGGIAVDVGGGKIYWTDAGNSKIQRANLDGTSVEDLLIT